MQLRTFMPKGLYWRTILIILVPAALLQLIISLVFLDDHWQATSKRMSQNVAGDVTLMVHLYERNPTPERFEEVRQMGLILGLEMSMERDGALEIPRCSRNPYPLDRYVWRPLQQGIGRTVFYDSTCPGKKVIIRVPTADGVMQVLASRNHVRARSGPLFIAWILSATVFLAIVTIVFIRNQVRPIEQLADAMERFGRGEDTGVFRVRGAREVRGATNAFYDMRARVRRLIDQRSQLLAGVSHDLRTPLTRLKLQFALMPPSPEIDEAKRDLAEMEETLEEYLAFAKGLNEEAPSMVDIAALAQEVAANSARGGAAVSVDASGAMATPGRARALKRCLANLIDNAAAHGDTVRVAVKSGPDAVLVSVEDDGPGIPESLYEEAFRPFSRLDETRSRNQKGVGLGLAIARDVARSHGGDIALSPSPLGGLCATLHLPRPA